MIERDKAVHKRAHLRDPVDIQSAVQVYLGRIRTGEASEASLRLASVHGDSVARLLTKSVDLRSVERIRTDADLAEVAKLPVKSLNLDGCYLLTDRGLGCLAELELEALSLRDGRFDGTGFVSFAKPSLVNLDLSNNLRLVDTSLSVLSKCRDWRQLLLPVGDNYFCRLT